MQLRLGRRQEEEEIKEAEDKDRENEPGGFEGEDDSQDGARDKE